MRFETLGDIASLIADRVEESVTLEYKRNVDNKRIVEDICAFANTAGGTLVCGVTDRDRIPVSINWVADNGIEERIHNLVKATIQPALGGIDVHRLPNPTNDAEALFIIDVTRSPSGPHMVHNRYYSRRGSVSSPMEDVEVRAAMFSTGRVKALRYEIAQNTELAIRTRELIDRVYVMLPEKRRPMAFVPFHADAWNGVVASGLLYSFDSELAERLVEAYRLIHEVNTLITWVNTADKAEPLVAHTPSDPSSSRGGTYIPAIILNMLPKLQKMLDTIVNGLPQ